MLGQTFRRPERLGCDLNLLGRSVKQVGSDDETFLSWVVSRDTSGGNKFVENVATFGNYKFANGW